MAEKLKVEHVDGVLEILANREGLQGLAEICLQLAALPEDDTEAGKLGNHYDYADYMSDASLELVIRCKPGM